MKSQHNRDRRLLGISIALCFFSIPHLASGAPAIVEGSIGHSWLVSHFGKCYAIVPSHVIRENPVFQLAVPIGLYESQATVIARLGGDDDIALAEVAGRVSGMCPERWDSLPDHISPLLKIDLPVKIVWARSGGQVDSVQARIVRYDGRDIDLKTTGSSVSDRLPNTISGAIVRTEDTIIGMIVSGTDVFHATARRIDFIFNNFRHTMLMLEEECFEYANQTICSSK